MRIRLYELLTVEGPATVSQLAEKLGAMVGTLSYHLRQLESYGYIEEAPELAHDRRERWWRAIPGGMRWSTVALEETPGGREASAAAERVLLGRQIGRLRGWREHADEWDPAWREAAYSTDMLFSLSSAELAAFAGELSALVHTWAERTRQKIDRDGAKAPDGDRTLVYFLAHAFPLGSGVDD